MKYKESQTNLLPHSEAKVKLLRTYLERFLNIMNETSIYKVVYVYDLFCSDGIYENNGEGSPITILKVIKEINEKNRSRGIFESKFKCIFNDIDKIKVERLSKVISSLNLDNIGCDIFYKTEDYKNLFPKIITKALKYLNAKYFLFIDPYGYSEIKASELKLLLDCKNVEIVLFLPTQFMFRFIENATPRALIEFINDLLPSSRFPKSKTGYNFIFTLRNAFKDFLGQHFFVDVFTIERSRGEYFCLFFFTNHIYGFNQMLESKWKLDEEQGKGWHYHPTGLPTLFGDTIEKNKFEKALLNFIKKKTPTNGEVYLFTLQNNHIPKHANEILRKFQNENLIKVVSENKMPQRKGAFYISYQEYRDNYNHVIFKYNQNGTH